MKWPGWLKRILRRTRRAARDAAVEEAAKGIEKVMGEDDADEE